LLLTSGTMQLIQLWTRRPVLLDAGALDEMAYVPQAAPQVDRILRAVYGIDTSRLPDSFDAHTARALWEERTVAEWQRIGHQFGVTDVLTYEGWALKLPVVARSSGFTLYGIP
jgi:hypothetical protein